MNQHRFNLIFGFNYRLLDHHWVQIARENYYNIPDIKCQIDKRTLEIERLNKEIERLNDAIKNIRRLNLDERIERLENGFDIYK